jgi:DNA-directed RNA polymerase subunit beta'
MNRNGSIAIIDDKGREKERYQVVYGAQAQGRRGRRRSSRAISAGEWDPYTFSILTEIGGTVQFKDLQEGITLNEEVDEVTGLSRLVVADSPDEKRQPAIIIKSAKGNKRYLMPAALTLMVQDGDEVTPGDILAKIPRETTRTKDITGGLPRVVELFEARKPRETAIISEDRRRRSLRRSRQGSAQDLRHGGQRRGEGIQRSARRHVNVQEGERLRPAIR